MLERFLTIYYCYRLQTQHVEVAIGHFVCTSVQLRADFVICSSRYNNHHIPFLGHTPSQPGGLEACSGDVKVYMLDQCQFAVHIMQAIFDDVHSAA